MIALRIAKRIILQLKNDKRTLALVLVAPLLVLTLLSVIFNYSDSNQDIRIGYYNIEKKLVNKINDEAKVISFDSRKNIATKIKDNNLSAFIYEKNDNFYIKYNDINFTNLAKSKSVLFSAINEYQANKIKDTIDDLQSTVSKIIPSFEKKKEKMLKYLNSIYI